MRVAVEIVLSADERTKLTKWSRGRSTPARQVLRAKIVLAAADDGVENKDIARALGCTRRTVGTWRNRFAKDRLEGIAQDAPRPGRGATTRAKFNIAENELSSLTRQCVAGRRFGDIETLRQETAAWSTHVNETQRGVDWQMKVQDARGKLKSVYPKILT